MDEGTKEDEELVYGEAEEMLVYININSCI
jgi:hypothetical protein